MKRHTCEACGKKRFEDRMEKIIGKGGSPLRGHAGGSFHWICKKGRVQSEAWTYNTVWKECEVPARLKGRYS